MGVEKPTDAQTAGKRLIVFAPNWLGDAVMALPAIDDVRRGAAAAMVDIAARPSVAPLFTLLPGGGRVVVIDTRGLTERERTRELVPRSYDVALLLPNSFHSAITAWRARIPERWGYRTQGRAILLTRGVATPPERGHQAMYYQRLTHALGFPPGPLEPRLDAPPDARHAGAELLTAAGWDGRSRLVALAPGAAYGGAKRWPAESFAAVATALSAAGITSVLVGGPADVPAGADVIKGTGVVNPGVINLIEQTDLPTLAGVLTHCRALISNDSGAMHLGAALGISVTAVFGPTNERETHPIGRVDPMVLTHDVWCRPCMLRECPLTHRCMRGVSVEAVLGAARRTL